MNRKIIKYTFLALGILATIFAIVIYDYDVGLPESYKSYGGDAYTGIQQAAAQTANNVFNLAEIVQTGFAFILLIHGGILSSISLCIEIPKKAKNQVAGEQITDNQSDSTDKC